MTTHQIRKNIHVADFEINEEGILIRYTYRGNPHPLHLTPKEAAAALSRCSVVDNWIEGLTPMLEVDDELYTWNEYAVQVGLWQYAALLLVVNYELEKAAEAEIDQVFNLFTPAMGNL